MGPYALPSGFTKTTFGGYKLGDAFNGDQPPGGIGAAGGGNSASGCGTTILGVVRDFKGTCGDNSCIVEAPPTHPDFETFDCRWVTSGLVPVALGADEKPGYTGLCEAGTHGASCRCGQMTTSKTAFDQWYRYTSGVNKPYILYLSLEPNGGLLTFQADLFFPLDNSGWGNSGTGEDNKVHNFGFTTEIHTKFTYKGGEKFTFIGDDDVWVFINGRLAVDLGGVHPQQTGSVTLDTQATTLGITKGNQYSLDVFHAERHTVASHFRLDTNIVFTNCGVIVPEPVIH